MQNTAQSTCATTDYIPCSPGKLVCAGQIISGDHNPYYWCTAYKEVSRARVFYDSNKSVISGVSENWYSENNTMRGIEVPNGASFVRISFGGVYAPFPPNDDHTRCFVYVTEEPYTDPTPYFGGGTETIDPDDSQTWEKWGQTWTLFGDSLTDSYGGHGWDKSTSPVGGYGWKDAEDPIAAGQRIPWTGYFWASDIARRHGYVLDNRAKSGSNIYVSRVYTADSGVYQLDAFLAELEAGTIEEPDLISIGFGANTVRDELGSPNDTSETINTLYGGTKYFIEQLNDHCPHARKVYILTPVQEGWRDTDGTARAAMKSVFDEYNVEYVDMSQHSGITVDMLPDKLHISSIEANRQYGRFLERHLFG